MSEFQGASNRVRCADCSLLSGEQCIAKKSKVAPKKRRVCNSYRFKGEYENRTPLEATYIPPVDKNTRRLLRKLLKMGVLPVSDGRGLAVPAESGQIVSPYRSTATAGVLKMGEAQREGEAAPVPEGDGEQPLIWTPDNDND